jgi:hypothetical protein
MAGTFAQIDAATQRLDFYRLEPAAALPDEGRVRARATAAGVSLPDDYVDYCCRFGAGAFEKHAVLELPADCPLGDQFWVDQLYAVGAKRIWDPIANWQTTYFNRLPSEHLPIGTDPGGNLLLLHWGESGGVFVWDHEHRELPSGEFNQRVAELQVRGIATRDLDVDQILRLWDVEYAERVANPTGHGNLYRVANSFAHMCDLLKEGNF